MKNHRDFGRRTLSVLLALVMLLSAAPFTAFAEAEEGEAVTVITGGATVGSTLMAVGGTGGDGGGGGEVGGSSDFVAPATDLVAYPGRWVNGKGLETFDDLEVLSLADDPNVLFFYHVKDSTDTTFGNIPTDKPFYPGDGEIQYVYVYSDTDPKEEAIRFFYLDSDCAPMADAFAYLPGN